MNKFHVAVAAYIVATLPAFYALTENNTQTLCVLAVIGGFVAVAVAVAHIVDFAAKFINKDFNLFEEEAK